jgi:DNA-binding CsgD family transcriptional regulator
MQRPSGGSRGRIGSGAAPATARGATPALVLHLCAFPQAGTRVRRGCLLGFLSALGCHAPARLAAGALASAFGLTPAEASVVLSLREHHDPTQVARELGLAVSTVRSHLKHAFRRTGTDRQAELLRLVDRLLDALPA